MSARVTEGSTALVKAKPTPKLLDSRLKRGVYAYFDGELHKRCSKCREYWPADSQFFYASASKDDGLICWCKACYIDWRWPLGRTVRAVAEVRA